VAQFNILPPRFSEGCLFKKNTFELLEEEFLQRGYAAAAFTPSHAKVK
jgi:hypothetical protein